MHSFQAQDYPQETSSQYVTCPLLYCETHLWSMAESISLSAFPVLRSPNTSVTLFWPLKYISRFKYIIISKDKAGRTKREHYILSCRRWETKRLFPYSSEEFQLQYWTSFGGYLQYSFTWQIMMIKLRHVNSSINKRVEFKALLYLLYCIKDNGSVVERTCTSKHFNSLKSTNRNYLEELYRHVSNGFGHININGTSIVQWGCVCILNLSEKKTCIQIKCNCCQENTNEFIYYWAKTGWKIK